MRSLMLIALLFAAPAVAGASETVTYTYDAHGRLVKVEHSGTVNDGVATEYNYDDANNRVKKKTTGV